MRYNLVTVLAAAALCGVCGRSAWAVGLRVSPGGALIQGVEPGERAEVPVPITVMNDDDEAKAVVFAALGPAREKMKVPPGYTDIPNLSWVSFSQQEVNVPAKGHAAVKMILNIPKGKEHYNQHWSISVAVRMKPATGQMLTLGLYPRFEIETAPMRVKGGFLRRATPPRGDLAVAPSTETLADVVPGAKPRRVMLGVWNNTAKPWRGEAMVIANAEAAKKERLDLSGGGTWLPDPTWVKLHRTQVDVGPKGSTELSLDLAVPDGQEHFGRVWEAIVLLRGSDGSVAFARLRVRTVVASPGSQGR